MDRRGYDGPSHVSVGGHLEKNERPLEIGSLSSMTVVQDGPSRVQQSVTCVHWDRGARDFAMDPMTVRRRYDGPSSGSRSK